jgi:hypothetical protein
MTIGKLLVTALIALAGCDSGERKRERVDPEADHTSTRRGDEMTPGDSTGQHSSGQPRMDRGDAGVGDGFPGTNPGTSVEAVPGEPGTGQHVEAWVVPGDAGAPPGPPGNPRSP